MWNSKEFSNSRMWIFSNIIFISEKLDLLLIFLPSPPQACHLYYFSEIRQDPGGYGLLYVDASQKANLGSSCSHSCNSNCTSAVVARNGKLVIVLTTVSTYFIFFKKFYFLPWPSNYFSVFSISSWKICCNSFLPISSSYFLFFSLVPLLSFPPSHPLLYCI